MSKRTLFNLMSSLKLMVSHHQKQHRMRGNSTITAHAQTQMQNKNFCCFFHLIFAAYMLLVNFFFFFGIGLLSCALALWRCVCVCVRAWARVCRFQSPMVPAGSSFFSFSFYSCPRGSLYFVGELGRFKGIETNTTFFV